MATFKQTLVNPDDTARASGGKGKRNDANIRASFPGSPIYNNEITDDIVLNQGIQALNGAQTDPLEADVDVGMGPLGEINFTGGYYGGPNINLNYSAEGGPAVEGQDVDAEGNPFGGTNGTPTNEWVPALTSNGQNGGTEPSDMRAYSGDLSDTSKLSTGTKQFGSGEGHKLDPAVSSMVISQQTIGNYTKGHS